MGCAAGAAVFSALPSDWLSFSLVAGWVATLIYVWLVGAQPPAVRTVLAMTLWMLLRLRGVHCSSWQVWLWCIGLILLCDPLAVLSDSFWLSVLAVGCLIFGLNGHRSVSDSGRPGIGRRCAGCIFSSA
ncbi:ComEC/Rec2 family competence protein [Serratia ureilytica]